MLRSALRRAAAVALLAGLAAGTPPELRAQDGANPFTTRVDIGKGRQLFDRHCSRCHGAGATGGETGPDLTTGRFRHASTDNGLFSVIRRGVDGTEMPPFRRANNDMEVWQVVSYLRSLSGGPRVEVPGDALAGERIYRGKGDCARCHMIDGEGGIQGPDLSTIGERNSPDDLRTALIDPDADVEPQWWTMRVRHSDGTRVEGRRMDEGTYSLRVLDEEGRLWSFLKRDLAEIERDESSPMPSYAGTLTDDELEDLIAYLYGLTRGEG